MNSTLQLKGTFEQRKNYSAFGSPNLPSGESIKSGKLEELLSDLERLFEYWQNDKTLPGALISVYYNKIAAKSNRIQRILPSGNNSIRGARYDNSESPRHIITHYVLLQELEQSINEVKEAILILNEKFNGCISYDKIKEITTKGYNDKSIFKNFQLRKTIFLRIIVDAYYVEKFDILKDETVLQEASIITIFKTTSDTESLLKKLGIRIDNNRIIDETTIYLYPDELNILKVKAPYLISMAVHDLSELTKNDFEFAGNIEARDIVSPQNEPTIGVIDTSFDQNVYFSKWVETTNLLSKDIPISENDYVHGTAVCSIIVDGPSLNPDLDDGCGRFKVKHYTVAAGGQFSSFNILKDIEKIVAMNPDIKVWNLSLGSKLEVNSNFISPEAAILDKILCENDVIFIIAGTNKKDNEKDRTIGSPADTINSIVVNSVTRKGEPVPYTRKGPVLSFFIKPDIAYFGGDNLNKIQVCTNRGIEFVQGTSFAAPWVSRKMCYLMSILGLSREEAKALLIHSSTTWQKQKFDIFKIGHGIIPQRIEDVVNTKDDDIQFIISGVSEEYDTYNYKLPIPLHQDKHPFIAKATLCYFPKCSRNQGVDYTNTELDIKIGRLKDKEIKSIDNNYQDSKGVFTQEKDARQYFRKWDNVKHIREI